MMKAVIASMCITLIFMHAFAFSQVNKMDRLELPLWFGTSAIPTLFVYAIVVPLLGDSLSGVIGTFVAPLVEPLRFR